MRRKVDDNPAGVLDIAAPGLQRKPDEPPRVFEYNTVKIPITLRACMHIINTLSLQENIRDVQSISQK